MPPEPDTTDSHRPLSPSQVLAFARELLPDLAREAATEARRRSEPLSLARRPASWALALLLTRCVTAELSVSAVDGWWARTDDELWQDCGLPRTPGRAEVHRYLTAAANSPQLKTRSARALLAVLPDIARSGQLPGDRLTPEGLRARVGAKTPRRPRRLRRRR